jgi:manganese/zinc/iron transport system substrate-binding protein
MGSVPPDQRLLVTAHDAFGYFGQRYGLQLESLQGISTDSEASLARVEQIVALLVARRVPAIFAESSVPDRAVRALIEGAEARGHRVALGGTLFSDAMGRPGTYEGTYEGMLDHNVTTIARALGGQVPARGLNGRLGGGA